jgi:membrane protein
MIPYGIESSGRLFTGLEVSQFSQQGPNGARLHDRNAGPGIRGPVESGISVSRVRQNLVWLARRVIRRCYADASFDAAAQVSFYFVLSLFPFLLMLAGLLGWLPTTGRWDAFAAWLTNYFPRRTQHTMLTIMLDLSHGYRRFLSFGLLLTIWSASTGFLSLMSALSQAYGTKDQRSYLKRRLIAMSTTISAAALLVIWFGVWNAGHLLVAIISQDFAYAVLFNQQWKILQGIATFLVLWLGVDTITWVLPGGRKKWRWVTPGSILSVLSLSATSSALNFYMNHAGSVSRLYGTLTGFIVIMLWIYVANLSLLIGAEMDAAVAEFKTHPAGA